MAMILSISRARINKKIRIINNRQERYDPNKTDVRGLFERDNKLVPLLIDCN